jgi:peroxiredoxin
MKRYVFSFSLIILSFVMMFLLQVQFKSGDTLHPGSPLPGVKYYNRNGFQFLVADSTKPLIVLYFHPDCEHCIYQLEMIEKNIDRFDSENLIFLTYANRFFADNRDQRWSLLAIHNNYTFGIVNENEFVKSFGTIYKPAIFIFNRKGILCSRFYGEVRIEKLLEALAGCQI